MTSRLTHALAASALGVAAAVSSLAAQSPPPLDGMAFVVEWGPKGQPADEKDDLLTFRDGQFHSTACDKYGFRKGAYQAIAQGTDVVFTAETTSDKQGRLAWKGRIESTTIEGTIVHYRRPWLLDPKPTPQELWFRGRLKQ